MRTMSGGFGLGAAKVLNSKLDAARFEPREKSYDDVDLRQARSSFR